MATLDELIAQLAQSGNRNYTYNPTPLPTVPTTPYRPDIGAPIDFNLVFGSTQKPSAAAASDSSGLPLWQRALMQVDRGRNAAVNVLDELTDGQHSSFGSILGAAKRGAALQDHTGFDKILGNLGWGEANEDLSGSLGNYIGAKLNNSSRKLVSFLGDVAFDPLTYATFGAGSLVKAGESAGVKAAKDAAKSLGVKATKELDQAPTYYAEQLTKKLTDQGMDVAQAERLAAQKTAGVAEDIQNAVRAAQNRAQNAAINFDVPFTRITKQFGTKPDILKITPQAIGTTGAITARQIARELGKSEDYLKKFYKVDKLEDLNVQQFNHLREQIPRFQEFQAQNAVRSVNPSGPRPVFQEGELINPGAVPSSASSIAPIADINLGPIRIEGDQPLAFSAGRSTRAPERRNIVDAETTPIKAPEFEFSKYVQGAGGRSKVGNAVGRVTDIFNPRTARSRDSGLANQGVDKLRDTENAIHAQQRQFEQELSDLAEVGKNLTTEQKQAIPYLIEGEFPSSGAFKREDATPEMIQIADRMRAMLQQMGSEEVAAGVLKSLRQGYFPHVFSDSLSAERLAELRAKYPDDPMFQELIGRSASNNFNKERKSFETLARVDNAIAKLTNAKNKAGLTPEQIAEIDDKIEIISNLFERDPFKVMAKRASAWIRSTSMKKLYDDFAEDGLVISPEKFSASPEAIRTGKYTKLDTSQAKAMGLEEGTYVHTELLDAMKRVDSIFTSKGMEKFVNQIEAAQNMWKTVVTTIPSHYWNNYIGNLFNNALAGISVKSYARASTLMDKARKGTLSAAEEKVFQSAIKQGVLHQNFYSDFIKANDRGKGTKFEELEKKFRSNKLTAYMQKKYGQPAENFTRFAHYVDVLGKTGSPKQAASSVRQYLFNYHELTHSDRVARLLIPFWNWTKNNAPLQIQKLMQNPRFYKQYVALKEQSQEGQDGPDFARESYFGILGNKQLPVNLPLNDLNSIFGNSGMDPLRYLASGANVLGKIPIEVLTNKNLFTNKPIDYEREYQGGVDPQAWLKYGLSQLGRVGSAAYQAGTGNPGEAVGRTVSPFGYPITVDADQEGG